LDPSLPTGDYQTLEAIVERSVSSRRFTLLLLVAFAAAALLLAALGIYGVLSYSVSERLPEIGIRMALGESRAGVLRRVVGKTMVLASIGLVIGIVGSFLVSRWVESLLYAVQPNDPWAFLSMAAVLLSVAAIAGFIPGLRAARTNAIEALRLS
jgi:ABC-type antimicrobial peptide transport system permease subunit